MIVRILIKEVYYHPTYSNRAAAVLRIDENPFVILSDSDDEFFGFWRKWRTKKPTPYNERNGLSYWMNKALKTNERFRRFAADFFYGVAEIENKYINAKDCLPER